MACSCFLLLEQCLLLITITKLVVGTPEIVRREAHSKINPSGAILTDVDELLSARPQKHRKHKRRRDDLIGSGFEAARDDGKPHLMNTIHKDPKYASRKDPTQQQAHHETWQEHGAESALNAERHSNSWGLAKKSQSKHTHLQTVDASKSSDGTLDNGSGANALDTPDDTGLRVLADSVSKPLVPHWHVEKQHQEHGDTATGLNRVNDKREKADVMHEGDDKHSNDQHSPQQHDYKHEVSSAHADFYRQCDTGQTGLLRERTKSLQIGKAIPFACDNGHSPVSPDGAVSSPAGATNRIRFYGDCNCNMNSSVFFFEPEAGGSGASCMAGDRITASCNECNERLRFACQGTTAQLRLFDRDDCIIDSSREVNKLPTCVFNLSSIEADKFLAGGCARVPPECGVGSIQGANNAKLAFEDCTPDEYLFNHPSNRPDTVDAFSDTSCAGQLQFYFQPTQGSDGPQPVGPEQNLCVPGDRVNVVDNPETCMPPLNTFSAAYHCDEEKARFVMFRNLGCKNQEPDCEFLISSSQTEEFRRGRCAVVLYPKHYTDDDIKRCGNVQSIIHRNLTSSGGNFMFRGPHASADCSPHTHWQAAENMNDTVAPLKKVAIPTETTKEGEEKRTVLLIILPIIICTFLFGTVFVVYYYRRHVKSQANQAAA